MIQGWLTQGTRNRPWDTRLHHEIQAMPWVAGRPTGVALNGALNTAGRPGEGADGGGTALLREHGTGSESHSSHPPVGLEP